MTLISRKNHSLLTTLVFVAFLLPIFSFAQSNSLTLSVSPTLFEMTANPTQEWVSSVRVINSNPYEITVYTDVVNFAPQGEVGQGKFIPVLESESDGQTLAEWIHVKNTEFTIPAEHTMEVPFTIKVPENAPPGGHFGAILIGTKSLNLDRQATQVETSQVVTALVFLRVTGDIIEDGVIREFRAAKYLSEKPEIDFELRFQNKGNVHILPQGEIRIFNMWGQERGVIPVNQQTMFGNVLPDSIRKYTFSWKGEWSLADIGRYRAEAVLAYGADSRQSTYADTAFWVLPWKIVLSVLGVIFAFVLLVTWAIKLYVRKMLALAGVGPNSSLSSQSKHVSKQKVSVVAPFEVSILDLRQRFKESSSTKEKLGSLLRFVSEYRIFFVVSLAIISFILLFILYVKSASVSERPYEVVIDGVDQDVTISSEQVEYESKRVEVGLGATSTKEGFPPIKIVNQSSITGLAAELRIRLESMGYPVAELTNELDTAEQNTVIVYAPEYAKEALALSNDTYGALLSAYQEASGTETPIIIYVGTDLENAVQ